MKNTTHFRVKRQNIFWLNHVEPPICLLIGAQHYWPIKTPDTATLIEKRRCLGVSTKLSDPFFVIFVSLWVPWYFGHHELMISCHVGEIPMSHTSHVRPCKPSCRTETNPSAESAIDWMWHLESLRLSLRYNLKYVGISYTILSTYLWLANHMTIFHITTQNHNVSWVNHRSKWLCSSSQRNSQIQRVLSQLWTGLPCPLIIAKNSWQLTSPGGKIRERSERRYQYSVNWTGWHFSMKWEELISYSQHSWFW